MDLYVFPFILSFSLFITFHPSPFTLSVSPSLFLLPPSIKNPLPSPPPSLFSRPTSLSFSLYLSHSFSPSLPPSSASALPSSPTVPEDDVIFSAPRSVSEATAAIHPRLVRGIPCRARAASWHSRPCCRGQFNSVIASVGWRSGRCIRHKDRGLELLDFLACLVRNSRRCSGERSWEFLRCPGDLYIYFFLCDLSCGFSL